MSRALVDHKTATAAAIFNNPAQEQVNSEWKSAESGDAKACAALMLRLKSRVKIANHAEIKSIIPHLNQLYKKNKNSWETKLILALYYLKLGDREKNKDADEKASRHLTELCALKDNPKTQNEADIKIIAEAHVQLGICFAKGIGVVRSTAKALSHYAIAEKMGDLDGTYFLTLQDYHNEVNDDDVFKRFHDLAGKGHIRSQYYLAKCYRKNIGVQVDKKNNDATAFNCQNDNAVIAFNWLLSAAQNHDTCSQFEVGLEAECVEKNDVTAFAWFQSAAHLNYGPAQNKVGEYCEYGRGIEQKSEEIAVSWYQLAAENQDPDGLFNYAHCLENGIGIDLDLSKAKHYYLLADKEKHPYAAYRLYLIYKFENNKQQMFEWCETAAKEGVFEAKLALAEHILNGDGGKKSKDPKQAIEKLEQLRKTSKGILTTFTLIKWYTIGFNGVAKDEKRAVDELELVSEQSGFPMAHYELACRLASGRGVARDIPRARGLYDRFLRFTTESERKSIVCDHFSCTDGAHHLLLESKDAKLLPCDFNKRNQAIFLLCQEKVKEGDSTSALGLHEAHFWLGCFLKGDQKTADVIPDLKQADQHLRIAADNFFFREYKDSNDESITQICCAAFVYANFIFHNYAVIGSQRESAGKYYALAEKQYGELSESPEVKKILAKIAKKKLQCEGKLDVPDASVAAGAGMDAKKIPSTSKGKNKNKKKKKLIANPPAAEAPLPTPSDSDDEAKDQKADGKESYALNPFSAAFPLFSGRVLAMDFKEEKAPANDYKQQASQIKQHRKEKQQRIEDIQKQYRNGYYQEALEKFKHYPNDIQAALGMVNCYLNMHQHQAAVEKITSLMEKYPDNLDILCMQITVKIKMKKALSDDDPHFKKLLQLKKQYPGNIRIAIVCIRVWRLSDCHKALQEASNLYQKYKNHAGVMICYARCLRDNGQVNKAWEIIQLLIKKNPNSPGNLLHAAEMSIRLHGAELAEKYFKDIFKRFPEFQCAKFIYFSHYHKIDGKKVLSVFNETDNVQLLKEENIVKNADFLLNKYKKSEAMLFNYAAILTQLGLVKIAKKFHEAVLGLNPHHVLALIALNMRDSFRMKEADFKGQNKELDKILVGDYSRFGVDEFVAYAKFLSYAKMGGDAEKSQRIFDRIIQYFPYSREAHEERILCLLPHDPVKCFTHCKEFLKKFPYEPRAYLVAIKVYTILQKEQELIFLQQQAQKFLGQDSLFLADFNAMVGGKSELADSNTALQVIFQHAIQEKDQQKITVSALDQKHDAVQAHASASSDTVAATPMSAAGAGVAATHLAAVSIAAAGTGAGADTVVSVPSAPMPMPLKLVPASEQQIREYNLFKQLMRAEHTNNPKELIKQLEKLADGESGNGDNIRAQNMLAEIYAGLDTVIMPGRIDLQQALHWWAKAAAAARDAIIALPLDAKQQHENFDNYCQRMLAKGDSVIAELTKHALEDNINALNLLAEIYAGMHAEISIPTSFEQAIIWWCRAVQYDADPAIKCNLGVAYTQLNDLPQALLWFEKSAKQGNTRALLQYGLAHIQGEGGVGKNKSKAIGWLKLAIVADHPRTDITDFALSEIAELNEMAVDVLIKMAIGEGLIQADYKSLPSEIQQLVQAAHQGVTLMPVPSTPNPAKTNTDDDAKKASPEAQANAMVVAVRRPAV